MARKFVITETEFRMANVELHADLCKHLTGVLGGGRWGLDEEKKNLYLWGASVDYGYAEPEKIKIAIKDAFLSPSLDKFNVLHSPICSNDMPELDTFVLLAELDQSF